MGDKTSDSGEGRPDFSFLDQPSTDSQPASDNPKFDFDVPDASTSGGLPESVSAADLPSGDEEVNFPEVGGESLPDVLSNEAPEKPDSGAAPAALTDTDPDGAAEQRPLTRLKKAVPTVSEDHVPADDALENNKEQRGPAEAVDQPAGMSRQTDTPPANAGANDVPASTGSAVSSRVFAIVAGYAISLTVLFLYLWLTGRLTLTGPHPLESLPDIEPLSSGVFKEYSREVDGQRVELELPAGHELRIGETRRFGDVEVTPLRVTREVVYAVNPRRKGEQAEARSAGPVLKLWLRFRNVSESSEFSPWDVGLMVHRHPKFQEDDSVAANSWLKVTTDDGEHRVLNFLHNQDSPYVLVKQNAGTVLKPGEAVETYVACSEAVQHIRLASVRSYRWRLQIRKGVSSGLKQGVTTFVDVVFTPDQIEKRSDSLS